MPRRPSRRYEPPVPESLTPDSGVRVTLKQALVAVGIVLGAGAAWGALKYDNAETRRDVNAIKEAQKVITATTTTTAKEQEERRAALGKEFLASNKEIATKVGDLATAVAVQQAQFKATTDALSKIGTQLDTLVRQMPEKRR